jgi:hypothetical protein
MYIPDILINNAEEIQNLDVAGQEVPFNIDVWRQYFPDIDDILAGMPSSVITRREIFGIVPPDPNDLVPCTDGVFAVLRQLFIIVMIWGYGNDGRGAWRTYQMVNSPLFRQTLCRVSALCYYGLFLMAFEILLKNIKWLGPTFASKYLYFLCYKFRCQIKPLILDQRVSNTMRTMNWEPGFVDWIFIPAPGKRHTSPAVQGYGQYLILVHNWADFINCRPDQIEYFLWR